MVWYNVMHSLCHFQVTPNIYHKDAHDVESVLFATQENSSYVNILKRQNEN